MFWYAAQKLNARHAAIAWCSQFLWKWAIRICNNVHHAVAQFAADCAVSQWSTILTAHIEQESAMAKSGFKQPAKAICEIDIWSASFRDIAGIALQ